MRRSVELCFVVLVVASGLGLISSETPSGMSPLSMLEARRVIGGGPPGDSGCQEGEALFIEDPPGTGCDSTCLRVANCYAKGDPGPQVPKFLDCPNRCGRFASAVIPCGS